MRAKEFTILKEDDGDASSSGNDVDASSSGNGGNTSGGTRGKIHQNHFDSIPDLKSYPDLPSHYYDMYRLGVHMAGSPDKQNMARLGPSGNEFVTLAFTDEDAAITNASRKAMGLKQISISSKGSRESDDVHRVSPVAKRKTNKYGI